MTESRASFVPTTTFRRIRRLTTFLVAFTAALSIAPDAFPASVTVSWNPVSFKNLRGYKIYCGTSHRNYSRRITLGKVTSGTVTNLVKGRTYYFAVTSYGAGVESGYSREVVFPPIKAPIHDTRVQTGDSGDASDILASDGASELQVLSGADPPAPGLNDGGGDSDATPDFGGIQPHESVYLEAEAGGLEIPLETGVTTSGTGFIRVPVGLEPVSDPLREGGTATYAFTVTAAGDYTFWGREYCPYSTRNSFFVSVDSGPFLTWNTAIVNGWLWDQVRDGSSGVPLKLRLGAGDHTLRIKQKEDGTRLDKILITSAPQPFPSTLYCAVSRGVPGRWSITDSDPPGAKAVSVFDDERGGPVTELSGSETANAFRLGGRDLDDWHNARQFVLEWSMKFSEDYVVSVHLQTTDGYREIRYKPLMGNGPGDDRTIDCGLGPGTLDGDWHTFARHLQKDLSRAQPGVKILEVNGFSVRGSGRIDNVKLGADR